MNLKGTKTEQNLLEAFAGESMARNKYSFYASKARKDGYEQIAAIFDETAENERTHAKMWFKILCGGDILGTAENLEAAAAGENEEWTEMYKRMAEEARAEGFDKIADSFEQVASIEKEHEERYLKLLANVNNNEVFTKPESAVWKCRECGRTLEALSAPTVCPCCAHPQAFFEIKSRNY